MLQFTHMFESFKPRLGEISAIDFENMKLEDPELQEITLAVTSKMGWEVDEYESAIAFMPEDGYEEALRSLQRYLDKTGHRYTDKALEVVLAEILDVGGHGYVEVI